MEKRISYSQFQQIKAAAKMIDPLYRKMQPLQKKIEELAKEYKAYQTQVNALEAGIVNIIGFHVSDLVKKVIEPTGKTDKNGKPLMITKYQPTDMVTYDEAKKQYVIHTPDNPDSAETIVPPTTADGPGSDYDLDKEKLEEQAERNETAENDQNTESFL